jgi:isoamylase
VLLNGDAIPTPDAYGGRIVDDSFFVMLNASETDLRWIVPGGAWQRDWTVELDTSLRHATGITVSGGDVVDLIARSMVVLCTPASAGTKARR